MELVLLACRREEDRRETEGDNIVPFCFLSLKGEIPKLRKRVCYLRTKKVEINTCKVIKISNCFFPLQNPVGTALTETPRHPPHQPLPPTQPPVLAPASPSSLSCWWNNADR